MGKTLVINMSDVKIEGDILDVTIEDNGIIYNISKEIEDEIAIDYVQDEEDFEEDSKEYDACTFFFNLSNIWGNKKREGLIQTISSHIKDNGVFYIWDINKERGRIVNNNVKVILPNNKIKEIQFKNYNPLISCEFAEIKKILEKYCKIEETKIWEDVFFLKGCKK